MNDKILIDCSKNSLTKGIIVILTSQLFVFLDLRYNIPFGERDWWFLSFILIWGIIGTVVGVLILIFREFCRIDPKEEKKIIEIGYIAFRKIPISIKFEVESVVCELQEGRNRYGQRLKYLDKWAVKVVPKKKSFLSKFGDITAFQDKAEAEDLVRKIESALNNNSNKAAVETRLMPRSTP